MSINLTTQFGRLKLISPVIVGACPLTGNEQTRAAIEAAGAGAIVLPSLFQEQVILWNERNGKTLTDHERRVMETSARNRVDVFCDDADTYLSIVNRASVLSSIPIIASLNGESTGNWLDFAGELQEAGAAAIELNVHVPPPSEYESPRDAEAKIVDLVSTIGNSITVPLFVKLGTSFTSLGHLSHRLLSGAQGIVLFGRSPDIDICLDDLRIKTSWNLTPSGTIGNTLRQIMSLHSFCPAMPLAACGGIGTPADVIKVLLAGADVAVITSALYREGPGVVRTLIDGLVHYMEQRQWQTIRDICEARPLEFATATQRLNYIKALASRPEASLQVEENLTHGDRWGHPQ
jgi:dihydroorotate dehydrogenase (fumarate)